MRLIWRKEEKGLNNFQHSAKKENLFWKPFLLPFFFSSVRNIHDSFVHFPFLCVFPGEMKNLCKLKTLLYLLLELSKTHWIIRSGWVASSFSWSRDILTYSILLRCVGVLHESTNVRVTVWTICYENLRVRFASLPCYLSEWMLENFLNSWMLFIWTDVL